MNNHLSVPIISVLTSLYRCEKYLDNYFSHVLKIKNLSDCEFIFIHNDPDLREREKIFYYLNTCKIINFQYIPVSRENLSISWNRGIKAACGEYIAIWNVNDIRFPESLQKQAEALTRNPEAGLVYGDKLISYGFNDSYPVLHSPKDISNNKWYKKFMDGSLIMWRKSVHDIVGNFDEQLIAAGDPDMWYRIGNKFRIIKVKALLGVYFFHNESLNKNRSAEGEEFLVGVRYGFFSHRPFRYSIKGLKNYKINKYIYGPNEYNCSVFKYKHVFIYFISLFYLFKGIFILPKIIINNMLLKNNKSRY